MHMRCIKSLSPRFNVQGVPSDVECNDVPTPQGDYVGVYEAARARHPRRWSGAIRDWSLPASVWLNPVNTATPELAQAA